MVKVIVADVDGTICDIDHILTKETKKTLNALLESGIKIGIASGRQIDGISNCWKSWGLNRSFDFYIGMNGAMLYDCATGIETHSHLMTFDQAMMIIEYFKPLGLNYNFYCDDNTHYIMGHDEQTEWAKKRHPELKIVDLSNDFHEMVGRQIYRILFRVNPQKMELIQHFVKENGLPEGFTGFQTQPICYEVMLSGISKAVALKQYCYSYNISLDDVYAFGDTSNDVEMLKCCHGVCLCNGTDDAKAVSEHITKYPCKESGFAKFVKERILK